MKKIIIALAIVMTSQAFAATSYNCKDVQRINGWGHDRSAPLTLATTSGLLSKKRLKSITLIYKLDLKNRAFEAVENPFTSRYAEYFEIEQPAILEATAQNFKEVTSGGFTDLRIAVSESILNGEVTGYAHFYKKTTSILESFSSSYYFKCTKM